MIPILQKIAKAKIIPLDRWKVEIIKERETIQKVMINYFSIGLFSSFHQVTKNRI